MHQLLAQLVMVVMVVMMVMVAMVVMVAIVAATRLLRSRRAPQLVRRVLRVQDVVGGSALDTTASQARLAFHQTSWTPRTHELVTLFPRRL